MIQLDTCLQNYAPSKEDVNYSIGNFKITAAAIKYSYILYLYITQKNLQHPKILLA
ncbi:hypothetical protein Sjap_018862 [Stephania japonica]|uniref:Uncharacterized protein n=1 Tax=Stephania japonica TaxID=461633 RepID=A0AAP0I8X2_9MAGN